MSLPCDKSDPLNEVVPYYETKCDESKRLASPEGQLRISRMKEIVRRYLPGPPAVVLDVGGGLGTYALWLAREGYEVHLVDPVPRHVRQAREASLAQAGCPLASIAIGDARELDVSAESVDAVLMFGPLYHLPEREDRLQALREARRVLRRDGLVFATCISRFASLLDGLFWGGMEDPEFVEIVKRDLADGHHLNPTEKPYFTTAYFHLPEELTAEVKAAGFIHQVTLAVEGPFWLLQNLQEHWSTPEGQQRILDAAAWVESEPAIIGASVHSVAIGQKLEASDLEGVVGGGES